MIELVQMKKSRKKPLAGDVFILQPMKDVYLFGKVIGTNLQSENVFVNGMNAVSIYKFITSDYSKVPILKREDMLLPLQVINNAGWNQGYFVTVDQQDVLKEEYEGDIGFEWKTQKEYYDIHGNQLEQKPSNCGLYALGNQWTVKGQLEVLYEENPNLFKL